jgi:hypothetical protein
MELFSGDWEVLDAIEDNKHLTRLDQRGQFALIITLSDLPGDLHDGGVNSVDLDTIKSCSLN